jgi:hypothetical protein
MVRYEWAVYYKPVLSGLVKGLTVQGLARGEGAPWRGAGKSVWADLGRKPISLVTVRGSAQAWHGTALGQRIPQNIRASESPSALARGAAS